MNRPVSRTYDSATDRLGVGSSRPTRNGHEAARARRAFEEAAENLRFVTWCASAAIVGASWVAEAPDRWARAVQDLANARGAKRGAL